VQYLADELPVMKAALVAAIHGIELKHHRVLQMRMRLFCAWGLPTHMVGEQVELLECVLRLIIGKPIIVGEEATDEAFPSLGEG
jgi:hypothetical protein